MQIKYKFVLILLLFSFFVLFLHNNSFCFENGNTLTFHSVFDESVTYDVTLTENVPSGYSNLYYIWNGNTSSYINIYSDNMSYFKENNSSSGSSSGIYTFDMIGTNSNKLYRIQLDPLTRYFLKFS